MIKKKTVLILGAGASKPFGFPLGKGLRDEIVDVYNPRKVPSDELKLLMDAVSSCDIASDPDIIEQFRRALFGSLQTSVDAFLEHRFKEFEVVGKRAIAATLLRYEQPARLAYMRGRDQYDKEFIPNWHELLFDALTTETSFEDFSKNQLSIVTFNYDRSLEFHLFDALQNSYGKSDKECADKLNAIPIVHVHGSLGSLPWQQGSSGPQLGYGAKIGGDHVYLAAENIKIIPEDVIDTPEYEKARTLIHRAQVVYFLGFGYGAKNLERLKLRALRRQSDTALRGTGLGLSRDSIRRAARLGFPHMSWGKLCDCTVYDFLRNIVCLTE